MPRAEGEGEYGHFLWRAYDLVGEENIFLCETTEDEVSKLLDGPVPQSHMWFCLKVCSLFYWSCFEVTKRISEERGIPLILILLWDFFSQTDIKYSKSHSCYCGLILNSTLFTVSNPWVIDRLGSYAGSIR